MPNYTYKCSRCGPFDAYGHFDESTKLCPKCDKVLAPREAVYREQYVSGSVGRVEGDEPLLPPKENVAEVQGELHQDMKKLGYDDDRLLEDVRGARVWDKEGNMSVDTSLMPKTLDTKGLKKKAANRKK